MIGGSGIVGSAGSVRMGSVYRVKVAVAFLSRTLSLIAENGKVKSDG